MINAVIYITVNINIDIARDKNTRGNELRTEKVVDIISISKKKKKN